MTGIKTALPALVAPVPTPLDADDRVDAAALARHLRWLAAAGADGALVLGSNGEFPSLTLEERRAVAEAAAAADSGLRLILGVGSCALREAVALTELAAALGYTATLLPPPFYFRDPPPAGLAAFLRRVVAASRLPVLLYHVPQLTGLPITDELIDGLCDLAALGGVKDSSGQPGELERLVARLPQHAYYVGSDRLVARARACGGWGSISAAANVAPALVAAAAADAAAQPRLDRLRDLLERYGLGAAVKALLRARGVGAYRTRPPLEDLDADRSCELVGEAAAIIEA